MSTFFSDSAAIANHILLWMRRLRTTFDPPVFVNIYTIIYFLRLDQRRDLRFIDKNISAGSVHAWNPHTMSGIVRSAYRAYEYAHL